MVCPIVSNSCSAFSEFCDVTNNSSRSVPLPSLHHFFPVRLQSGLCLMEPEKSTYLIALKELMLTENVSGKCHPNLNVTGLSLGWHVS